MTAGDHDPAFQEWVADAKAAPLERAVSLCGFVAAKGHDKGVEHCGPCPACGGRDRFAVHFVKRRFNCRQCGAKGRDALALALVGENLSFVEACEELSGRPRPASQREETSAEREDRERRRAEREAEREAAKARRDMESARYREAERRKVHKIWRAGAPIEPDHPVGLYLAARRLEAPPGAHLRAMDRLALFGETVRGRDPVVLHEGPAMLAGITAPDGRFGALHMTWVDPAAPGRKIEIADPETGELSPAKKVRGSKKGGRIELVRLRAPVRLFVGEGIETVLSVWMALRALASPLLDGAAFWASVDLGNLGGPASGKVQHPTEKTANGRARRIPSADPDWSAPAIPIPDSVDEVVLLGDGDSDDFLTRTTLRRAAARWARPGRVVRGAMAPAGADFNDVWRAA